MRNRPASAATVVRTLFVVLLVTFAGTLHAALPQEERVMTASAIDENRVLMPERVSDFVDRAAYRNDASIADLLAESHLRVIEGTTGVWLQRAEQGVSVLALGVEPVGDDAGVHSLLLIISAGGSDYPILTDAPLGSGALRLQLLGTNEAVRVTTDSASGVQVDRIAAFDPLAKQETSNALRGLRSDGLTETLSCLVGVLFSNFSWADIACATADYAICVAGSGGAGLVSCAVAFKQLLPDCSSTLPALGGCFGIATDTTLPGVTISQPASGATVSGTKAITASASDNALKAITIQVEYQASSGRKIAPIADSQNLGGCSLSSTSATCSTQFNFGLATNGSTATIRVTATDTAGNVGRASRNVIVSSTATTYLISGNAGQSGVGISGCNQTTQTDANGNYQLNGCTAGAWTVIPSKSGCTFTPSNRSVQVGPNATAQNFTPSCTTPGLITLVNNQTISSLSGSAGSWRYFKITVPSSQSQLKITMSGGTGDADLYVRRGATPTTSSWDYRPYLSGSNEGVTIPSPLSGDWYIGINAYSSYSALSLNAVYSATAGCTSFSGSLAGTGYVGYAPSSSGYTSSVSGTHIGKLTGTGFDFDLYLQKYSNSTWTTVAYSTSTGSTENVSYNGTAGTYRWRILSYSGSGTYSVCVTHP